MAHETQHNDDVDQVVMLEVICGAQIRAHLQWWSIISKTLHDTLHQATTNFIEDPTSLDVDEKLTSSSVLLECKFSSIH